MFTLSTQHILKHPQLNGQYKHTVSHGNDMRERGREGAAVREVTVEKREGGGVSMHSQ